jgi:RES domain-containing protein
VTLDVDAVSARGVFYRHVPVGRDPLARPVHPPDGRWQRGDTVAGLYLADSAATAWAEWYRALAEYGIPPGRWLPRALWRITVRLERVADLTVTERLGRVGLGLPHPVRRDWPRFQAVGEQLFAEGFAGVLYPAAARPEAVALCVFWTPAHAKGVKPRGRPVIHREPPTPPRGLRT